METFFVVEAIGKKKTLINEWIEKNPRAFDKTQKIMEHTRRKARAQKMTHE